MQDTITRHRKKHTAKNAAPSVPQWQRMKALADDLKQLVERNNSVFDDENIRRQIAVLERWMDHYCRDLVTAETFYETSAALLADLGSRLKLTTEERQRLEGEGGLPATREQAEQNEEMLKTIRRIETIVNGA